MSADRASRELVARMGQVTGNVTLGPNAPWHMERRKSADFWCFRPARPGHVTPKCHASLPAWLRDTCL